MSSTLAICILHLANWVPGRAGLLTRLGRLTGRDWVFSIGIFLRSQEGVLKLSDSLSRGLGMMTDETCV